MATHHRGLLNSFTYWKKPARSYLGRRPDLVREIQAVQRMKP
jgi:hypothetical protein